MDYNEKMRNKQIAILLLVFFIVLLSGCKEEINNTIIQTIESPNQKYIAYVFTRNINATTKTSYQLSILPKDDKFGDNTGNILISYGSFEVEWNSANEITVKKNETGEVFKQETKYGDIGITYNY